MTREQIEKLPKWAQIQVRKILADKESLEQKMSQIEGRGETNTFISAHPTAKPLPRNTRIVFEIEGGKIEVYNKTNCVEVHAQYDNGRLCVMPNVSNGLQIAIK